MAQATPAKGARATQEAFSNLPTDATPQAVEEEAAGPSATPLPEGGLLVQVLALVPLVYFDVLQEEGRRGYTENFVGNGRFAKIIAWVPFIILMAMPCNTVAEGPSPRRYHCAATHRFPISRV